MSPRSKRVLKVGCSGVFATVVDLVVLLILVEALGVSVVFAVFVAASSGAAASFLVNKYWAFGDAAPVRLVQVLAFATVALGSALGVSALVFILSVKLGFPYLVAKGLGAVLIFALWSYPAQSRVVFRGARSRLALEV